MKKWIIGISIVLVLIMIGIIIWKYLQNKSKPREHITSQDVDGLTEITYSSSGNSNGNIDRTTLYTQDKMIVTEYKNYHNEPLEVTEYSVSEEDIQALEKEINQYNFPMWKDIPVDTEMIALDGPSTSICFKYHKKGDKPYVQEYYCVSHNAELSKKQWEQLSSFEKKLFDLCKKENKIRTYKKKDD